jgi:hypothetical protein
MLKPSQQCEPGVEGFIESGKCVFRHQYMVRDYLPADPVGRSNYRSGQPRSVSTGNLHNEHAWGDGSANNLTGHRSIS